MTGLSSWMFLQKKQVKAWIHEHSDTLNRSKYDVLSIVSLCLTPVEQNDGKGVSHVLHKQFIPHQNNIGMKEGKKHS